MIWIGILAGVGAVAATPSQAQVQSKPQPSPLPPPPPIYTQMPAAPPPAPPRSGKERSASPTGNPSLWMTEDDYPSEARRNDEQGTTAFRLTVGPDGAATACNITSSSGYASLDDDACRLLLQRARFTPALDKKGRATTGSWASRFRWVLPEPTPGPLPFTQTTTLIFERDGSASGCSTTVNGASIVLEDEDPCAMGKLIAPYTDAAGNPVRRRVTATTTLTVTDPDAPLPAAAPPPRPAPPKSKKP